MRKLGLIIALTALGTGSVYADNFPLPSFNDAPETYSHGQSSAGASTYAAPGQPAAQTPDRSYGPWIVIPSSGE